MESDAASRRIRPRDALFTDWPAPDGRPLRRMDWLQPDGAAVRGSLLFAGGRGDFIEKYLEIYLWWHARGWNVTAFDWRGQGGSRGEGAIANLTDFGIWIDDFAALITDWRAQRPGPHVAVAHSMGGHLLLRTVTDKGMGLDAAVLVAPMLLVNGAPVPPWLAPWMAGAMALVDRDRLLRKAPTHGPTRQRHLTGASPERYEDETWWWGEEPGFNVGTPSWGWLRATYRSAARAFTAKKLAKVDVPMLLLGAETDRLVSAEAIRRAAALLPRADLHMYPQSAHEILREGDDIRLDALVRIDVFFDEHAR